MGSPMVLAWLRTIRDLDGLSPGATALAALLVTFANSDGSSCRPGDDRLCTRLGVSPRTLRRWRAELQDAVVLQLDSPAAGPGRGRAGGTAAVWRLIQPGKDRTQVADVFEKTGHRWPKDRTQVAERPDTQGHPTSPRPPQDLKPPGVKTVGPPPSVTREGERSRAERQDLSPAGQVEDLSLGDGSGPRRMDATAIDHALSNPAPPRKSRSDDRGIRRLPKVDDPGLLEFTRDWLRKNLTRRVFASLPQGWERRVAQQALVSARPEILVSPLRCRGYVRATLQRAKENGRLAAEFLPHSRMPDAGSF